MVVVSRVLYQKAITWTFYKSVVAYTLYVVVQILQPFLPLSLWCLSGFLYYLVAVQTLHEVSHGTLSPVWWYFLSGIGLGGMDWQAKHLKHHSETNETTDPELIVSPLLRLHRSQPHKGYHVWQHLYAWPLYGLLHLSIWKDMLCGTPNPWRGASYPTNHAFSYSRRLCFLWLHLIWPYYVTGCMYMFVYEWMAWTLPSLFITVCFQCSHVMDDILLSPQRQTWDSVAWCPQPWITEWLGGLNMQPYHHKYPSLPHTLLHLMRERHTKDRAPEVQTFGAALVQHYKALKRLGRSDFK